MASRRLLKKNVNYIIAELCTECLATAVFAPNADQEKGTKLLKHIISVQNEFLSRISHTEPGNVKGFYKKFHEDFNKETEQILKELNEILENK